MFASRISGINLLTPNGEDVDDVFAIVAAKIVRGTVESLFAVFARKLCLINISIVNIRNRVKEKENFKLLQFTV